MTYKQQYTEWVAQQVKDFKEQWETDYPVEKQMNEQQATVPLTFEQWWGTLDRDDFLDTGSLAEKAWQQSAITANFRPNPPKTQWKPKIGNIVFGKHINGNVSVLRINIINEHLTILSSTDCNGKLVSGFAFKPFNKSYVGRPWSEIPNTPEDGE